MTDRELLELAAKAAGVAIQYWHADGYHVALIPNRGLWGWNPLQDDGDALRLAVKCGIDIELQESCVYASWSDGYKYQLFDWNNGDQYAATRRAITRAAAEIGKAMP